MTKKYIIRIIVGIVLVLILILLAMRLKQLICILLWSVAIFYLLLPLQKLLERFVSPSLAAGIIMVTILALVALLLVFVLPYFIRNIREIIGYLPKFIQSVESWLSDLATWVNQTAGEDVYQTVVDFLSQQLNKTAERITEAGFKALPSGNSLLWLIIPFIMFYLLKDREKLTRIALYVVPTAYRTHVLEVGREINRTLQKYITGQLAIALIVGSLVGLALALSGVRYSVLLGLIVGVLNVVPYIGFIISIVPVIALSLLSGVGKMLAAVIIMIAVQQLESIVIAPKIMSVNLEIHPVLILLAILSGGILAGTLGMVYALPAVIVIKGIIKSVNSHLSAKKRSLQ